ncbi:MAG: hypothetical protein KJZ92_03155 [Rhodocyclaceae bacterium]|mgnify:FL=1|jgi:hypothetical protein|nr:hypothetical protein [Rhodocyclaceae bacterium]MBZ0143187.1 hypothetical protein [Rhodocyclaceae bacterium]MCL4680248.1 hypothetical protein [Rhodocyclaceae bacterium]
MDREEFESRLRDSHHFRQSLADLFQSVEQAMSLVVAATGRQMDAARLEAALLDLQSRSAADSPDAARDHILNEVRRCLKVSKQD